MVSYLHEDDLRAAQKASDDEGMALIEAHRAWDARRKVLEEAVVALLRPNLGNGYLCRISDAIGAINDLIGPEPTDG